MEECMVNISPYVYHKELEYEKSVPGDPAMKIELKGIDVALIRSLAKYGLLNYRNLERAISLQIPAQLRKPDYKKEVRGLKDAGYLAVYRYPETETQKLSGRENTVLYALSDKGLQEAEKRRIHISHSVPKGEKYKTVPALELAQLNQWHIAIKRLYGDIVKDEYYEHLVHVLENKGVVIRSIFQIKSKKLSYAEQITLAAVPYPKECNSHEEYGKNPAEVAKGVFLNDLLSVNAFFKEKKNLHHPMIVVLVDGFTTMEKAYHTIYSYRILQNLPVFFCMDIHTDGEHVLSWIYRCSVEENRNTEKGRQMHFQVVDLFRNREEATT